MEANMEPKIQIIFCSLKMTSFGGFIFGYIVGSIREFFSFLIPQFLR